MNLVIVLVVVVVGILIPTALVATFTSTKDTYRYQRHYGPNGYSQELEADGKYAAQSQLNQSTAPVENWPEQL